MSNENNVKDQAPAASSLAANAPPAECATAADKVDRASVPDANESATKPAPDAYPDWHPDKGVDLRPLDFSKVVAVGGGISATLVFCSLFQAWGIGVGVLRGLGFPASFLGFSQGIELFPVEGIAETLLFLGCAIGGAVAAARGRPLHTPALVATVGCSVILSVKPPSFLAISLFYTIAGYGAGASSFIFWHLWKGHSWYKQFMFQLIFSFYTFGLGAIAYGQDIANMEEAKEPSYFQSDFVPVSVIVNSEGVFPTVHKKVGEHNYLVDGTAINLRLVLEVSGKYIFALVDEGRRTTICVPKELLVSIVSSKQKEQKPKPIGP